MSTRQGRPTTLTIRSQRLNVAITHSRRANDCRDESFTNGHVPCPPQDAAQSASGVLTEARGLGFKSLFRSLSVLTVQTVIVDLGNWRSVCRRAVMRGVTKWRDASYAQIVVSTDS